MRCAVDPLPDPPLLSVPYGDSGARIMDVVVDDCRPALLNDLSKGEEGKKDGLPGNANS